MHVPFFLLITEMKIDQRVAAVGETNGDKGCDERGGNRSAPVYLLRREEKLLVRLQILIHAFARRDPYGRERRRPLVPSLRLPPPFVSAVVEFTICGDDGELIMMRGRVCAEVSSHAPRMLQ